MLYIPYREYTDQVHSHHILVEQALLDYILSTSLFVQRETEEDLKE